MLYIKPSQYSMEIVGENSYQKAIQEVILFEDKLEKDNLEYCDDQLTAKLILENDNKFDRGNAVRVELAGKTVGYLAKADAQMYRKALLGQNVTEPCTCKAEVYGRRADGSQPMKFGVWLFINLRDRLEFEESPKNKKLFGIFLSNLFK
jgi:hypothetical protein